MAGSLMLMLPKTHLGLLLSLLKLCRFPGMPFPIFRVSWSLGSLTLLGIPSGPALATLGLSLSGSVSKTLVAVSECRAWGEDASHPASFSLESDLKGLIKNCRTE